MTKRENYLRMVRFERPDYIPMCYAINPSCWNAYPQEQLLDLMEAHPFLFPDFKRPSVPLDIVYPPIARKDRPYRDDFGCIWQTARNGITGTVTGHPLESWDAFSGYRSPDPQKVMGIGPIDWEQERRSILNARKQGDLVFRGLRHGHTFLQLCDIRGYENLLFDMMDEAPLLPELIDLVEQFNLGLIKRYCALGVDVMGYAEDLGMQYGPMLSPEQFSRYILPSYRRLIAPARESGAVIHMHSDGDIRLLLEQILSVGVDIINLQDLVNGIDWIKTHLAGRCCIELDIDRQSVTINGTPEDIDRLILNEIRTLGTRQGGLCMIYGLYPGTPIENAAAVMDAMEKYAFYFS